MEDDHGVRDFLLRYPDLVTTADILTDLAKVNPNLFNDILMLGMVIAIHSEVKYKLKRESYEKAQAIINKAFPDIPSIFKAY